MRSEFFLRTLSIVGAAIVLLASGAGLFSSYWLLSTETQRTLLVIPIIVSAATTAGGLGMGLHFISRRFRGGTEIPPHLRAALSSNVVAGVEFSIAILLWSYATWWVGHLIDHAVQGYHSVNAVDFDLVLGVPLGILLPLAAGWTLYAAAHVQPRTVEGERHEVSQLLGNVLATFGALWIAFVGTCAATGAFSGASLRGRGSLMIATMSFAYGGAFLFVGWFLRTAGRTSNRADPPVA